MRLISYYMIKVDQQDLFSEITFVSEFWWDRLGAVWNPTFKEQFWQMFLMKTHWPEPECTYIWLIHIKQGHYTRYIRPTSILPLWPIVCLGKYFVNNVGNGPVSPPQGKTAGFPVQSVTHLQLFNSVMSVNIHHSRVTNSSPKEADCPLLWDKDILVLRNVSILIQFCCICLCVFALFLLL